MDSSYRQYSDERLVELAQAGDYEAEEALIRRYREIIKGKAHTYYIAGADNEDVIQEGTIGIYKAIKGYNKDGGASFKTFAGICINRQIIDAIRVAGKKKNEPLNSSISLNTPVGEDGTLLDSIADTRPSGDNVYDRINDLIENEGDKLFSNLELEVLKRFVKGMSYDEIADNLGKEYKSIDNAIQRIKKKINKNITD